MYFYATTNTSQLTTLQDAVVTLNQPLVNVGQGFGLNNFTCPKTGIYWFFYTVVWDGAVNYAHYSVTGLSTAAARIFRNHTVFNGYDTISRDAIRNVTIGQTLSVTSLHPLFADATTGSAFGGFLLDTLMSSLVRLR